MNFDEVQTSEEKFQVATYAKMNIAVETGKGCWIETSNGEKYLDLYGGHAVCATGHAHPHVVQALKNQAEKVLFYSNLVYSEIRARAAEKLVSIAPEKITKAFFCNSGTEANENAMRMARFATKREKVITFTGGRLMRFPRLFWANTANSDDRMCRITSAPNSEMPRRSEKLRTKTPPR